MPETPMPAVNGHVTSDRLLHASRSISSFTPAAAMFGTYGFTATAGSFCLFCVNGDIGLPAVGTCVSLLLGVAAATPRSTVSATKVADAPARIFFMCFPPLKRRLAASLAIGRRDLRQHDCVIFVTMSCRFSIGQPALRGGDE